MDEKLEDLLPFYALGVLADEEEQQVEAFISSNPDANNELAEFQWSVAALPYGATPVKPASSVAILLMDRVNADPTVIINSSSPTVEPSIEPEVKKPSFLKNIWSQFRGHPLAYSVAGLGLVLAILAGVWALTLQNQVNRLNQELFLVTLDVRQRVGPLQAENALLKNEVSAQQETLASFENDIDRILTENEILKQAQETQSQVLIAQGSEMARLPGIVASLAEMVSIQTQALRTMSGETMASLINEVARLQIQNRAMQGELSAQRAAMAELTTPDVQVTLIAGTEALPQAQGHLVADPANDSALLIVAGLPPLQPGQAYQFWFVQDGQTIGAGTVDVDEQGRGLLLVSSDQQIGLFDGMGISVEPEGGSLIPTNNMIMLGEFTS